MHNVTRRLVVAGACVAALSAMSAMSAQSQDAFTPARYRTGALSVLPALALGGGEVFLEVSVNNEGRVTGVTPLRTTAGLTDAVVGAVRGWQFVPADVEVAGEAGGASRRQRVASKVLVAGLFRPPTITAPTLGEVPKDVASESDETPFPLTTNVPLWPPLARDAGVVLVEVRVDVGGTVTEATVIRSAPGFDDAAQAAARLWRFRPARVRGRSVVTRAYLLFGFPTPITPAPPPVKPTPPTGGPR